MAQVFDGDETSINWLDSGHQYVQDNLQDAADGMNSWFGEPDPAEPARVQLRFYLDSRWNHYDGYSLKPRLRGRIKLPTLEDRLNVVFGDDTIDDEQKNAADIMNASPYDGSSRGVDGQQTRRENSSLGLQWLIPNNREHLHTRLGAGMRTSGDIYLKAELGRDWQLGRSISAYSGAVYRYGTKSEHYARTDFDLGKAQSETVSDNSQLRFEYRHRDGNERWNWSNSFFRRHQRENDSWFNYGIYTGGAFSDGRMQLDSYGPFVGLRQNMYRDWFFVQPEITYYNDDNQDRKHHVGVMLRLEAQF